MKDFQDFRKEALAKEFLTNIGEFLIDMGICTNIETQQAAIYTSIAILERYHEWLNAKK